jgi:hypothetical protein
VIAAAFKKSLLFFELAALKNKTTFCLSKYFGVLKFLVGV